MRHARRRYRALIGALAGLALVLASTGLTVGSPGPAAAATDRSISGHVYLGDLTRSATAGEVKVSWLRSGYTPGPSQFTYTDAAGNYALTGLTPASGYSVRFDYIGTDPFGPMLWPDKAAGSPG